MDDKRRSTQDRIDAQAAIVSSLKPGSDEHRLATKILLLLQDSLMLLLEIEALTNEVIKARDEPHDQG